MNGYYCTKANITLADVSRGTYSSLLAYSSSPSGYKQLICNVTPAEGKVVFVVDSKDNHGIRMTETISSMYRAIEVYNQTSPL